MSKLTLLIIPIIIIYSIYCICVSLIAPQILKPIITSEADKALNGKLSFTTLKINPLRNTVTLTNINLKDAQGKELVTADSAFINISLLPLIFSKVKLESIELENLAVYLLKLNDEDTKKWLSIKELKLTDLNVDIKNNNISIDALAVKKLFTDIALLEDNTLDILALEERIKNLLELDETLVDTQAALEKTEESTKEWGISLAELNIKDSMLSLTDQNITTSETTAEVSPNSNRVEINASNITVKNIRLSLEEVLDIEAQLQLLGGEIIVEGSFHPSTFVSDLEYSLNAIDLNQINSFIEHYSLASIANGILTVGGNVKSDITDDASSDTAGPNKTEGQDDTAKVAAEAVLDPKLNITADISLESFILKHQSFDEDFLNCKNIIVKQIAFNLKSNTLNVSEVNLGACNSNIITDKNSISNFSFVKPETNKNTEKAIATNNATKQSTSNSELEIAIEKILANNSFVSYQNFTLPEPLQINLNALELDVRDVKKGSPTQTSVKLNAQVNGYAPLNIEGTANFLNPNISTNLSIQLEGFGVTTFSPYIIQFSGRPAEKGIVDVKVNAKILEAKLDSDASILLSGFELGKKESLLEGSKLPIKSALSLLKNSKGEISLNFPIKGNINDPSFSLKEQIFSTLQNLLKKVVMTPASLITRVFKSSRLDDFTMTFKNNETEINKENLELITALANYLNNQREFLVTLQPLVSKDEASLLSGDDAIQALSQERLNEITKQLVKLEVKSYQFEQRSFKLSDDISASQVDLTIRSR